MHTSGGRVSTVINGVQFSSRNANIKLDPSNINVSVASNGDGTNYRRTTIPCASVSLIGNFQIGGSLACDPDITPLKCILDRVIHAHIVTLYQTEG
jgi:hypothetical protein